MAVAAAETKEPQLLLTPETRPDIPGVVSIAELPGDAELISQARRNYQAGLVANIAVSETAATPEQPIRNIREGFVLAAKGDPTGQKMAKANIRKDANERIYKAGNVVSANLQIDAVGNVRQYGQNTDDIQRNAYQMASVHPVIKERTIAEANNNARIKNELKKGSLLDNYVVVISICAEGLSDEKLDELNFFSLTKSMSIQATTENEDGLLMESAFVAGVKDEDSERHDRQVVEALGRKLGVDYTGKSAAQIIDMPILVTKSMMPDGVVDIVKMIDGINGGTFFGQNKPARDYVWFKEFCRQREAAFEGDTEKVYGQLISELDSLPTAATVSHRLGKLVGQRMVKRAINDADIDSRVFGSTSSEHIEIARTLRARGMYAEAAQHTVVALISETSGSCPSAMNALSLLSLSDQQSYMMAGGTEAILALMSASRAEKGWHGGRIKDGECVKCEKKTKVGVKSYCKQCINC